MSSLSSYERIKRVFEHRIPDRIPIMDYAWPATIERWQSEGLPKDVSYIDYFDLDKTVKICVDTSPCFEKKLIEETDEYRIETTEWGATMKNWKHAASVPEFLDFKLIDKAKWLEAKKRIQPDPERIPWNLLKENYATWRKEGYWIEARLWFGFDVTHSWVVGTERVLMAMAMEPEWLTDMFNTFLDINLKLLEMAWDAGYEFDSVKWCDDMGYKQNQFFSVETYRKLLKPVQKRAVDWAHARGVKAHLHSCGDINPLVPELIDIGIDALNPLEVKAGMDPLHLKQLYGDKLVFHGGLNTLLFNDYQQLEAEVKRIVPKMKENSGYIFASDHSIPSDISFQDFGRLINLIKELGSYE